MSARSLPATCVVFDLLYEGYRSLLTEPLSQRRKRLCQLVEDLGRPQIVFSEGIVGPGRALFEEVCRQGLEGLVAKRLTSRYRPGKRTANWLKIKPRLR
jgi:bifunctional non-homologous end joining protein LigD